MRRSQRPRRPVIATPDAPVGTSPFRSHAGAGAAPPPTLTGWSSASGLLRNGLTNSSRIPRAKFLVGVAASVDGAETAFPIIAMTRAPPVLVAGATGRVGRSRRRQLIDARRAWFAPSASLRAGATCGRRTSKSSPATLPSPSRWTQDCTGVRCRFPRLDRAAGDCSGCHRTARHPRAACSSSSRRRTTSSTRSSSNQIRWRCSTPRSSGFIADAGLESTIIRPGIFASNALLWWAAAIRGTVSSGGRTVRPRPRRSMHRDAAVAARTLSQAGHVGGDRRRPPGSRVTQPGRAGEHHR